MIGLVLFVRARCWTPRDHILGGLVLATGFPVAVFLVGAAFFAAQQETWSCSGLSCDGRAITPPAAELGFGLLVFLVPIVGQVAVAVRLLRR